MHRRTLRDARLQRAQTTCKVTLCRPWLHVQDLSVEVEEWHEQQSAPRATRVCSQAPERASRATRSCGMLSSTSIASTNACSSAGAPQPPASAASRHSTCAASSFSRLLQGHVLMPC